MEFSRMVNVEAPPKRLTHLAPFPRRCLLLAGLLLLLDTSSAAVLSNESIAGTSRELYIALSTHEVSIVYLIQTLRLDSNDWSRPLTISRNVTVVAHQTFQAIKTYITLDLASLAARVYLSPGVQLTFKHLEMLNYVTELGQTMLLLGASRGARVAFENVVQRRRVGFTGKRNADDLLAMPRLESEPGVQQAFPLPRFCYNVSRDSKEQCLVDTAYVVKVATRLPSTRSPFFSRDTALGEYDMIVEESAHAADMVVSADCFPGASEWDCIVQQLKLLDIQPVIIKTKARDSNLVKIVASLAILAVSVVLFLYFRRHYRTYQERRARRMRRIKEALGMGPEAHGVMFNGLDGDDPDWQIMPMPGGYAPDEEGPTEWHQDSNIRNFIKDISTRPNRQIPEYGDGEEVRIDMDNCPIAAEVGLRRTPGGGGPGAALDTATQLRDLDPTDVLLSSGASPAKARGAAAVAGTAAVVSGGLRASVGSGTTAVSHRSASVTSGSRTTGTGVAAAAAAQAGCGGGTVSPRRDASTLAVTVAGMDLLLASRAAAVGAITAVGSGDGGGDRSGARSGGRSGARSGGMASGDAAASGPGTGQGRASRAQLQLAVTGQLDEGAAAASANRHAVNFAAADVATRVERSKDSDDDVKDGARANSMQATNLMDELEELRRDIMAGINDTQLQIMSVVGSGAFGTVYRGQWQGLEVAVKTVVFSASSENRKRALQEAALCQSINHRNIVATYAVDVQPLGAVNTPVLAGNNAHNSTLSNLLDWRLYIVQEYCDGGPLRKLVQSQYLQTSSGPNMPVICEVALELGQALAHLHSKNVIHGDLNPNNVLLKRDASSPIGFRVKMADFGLSVMVPIQKTHMSNLRLGTLYYIAPETCFRGQLGYAADVFSLGVMLWELYHGRLAGTRTATGEPRYQPDFPDFPAACPVDYRKLAHRCLQKQPHNRLHSSQVVQRLQEMLAVYRSGTTTAAPLPPLPLGGPDESTLTQVPAGPLFAQAMNNAINNATTGTPTPTESRHRPASPANAAAAVSPEISPWAAADPPQGSGTPGAR